MGHGTGESSEGHNEYAGAHGGLQLVAQDAGEDEEHHHAAARANKAADKANEAAADQGLDGPLFRGDTFHSLLGGHHRSHNELNAQQERHKHGEAAHGLGRQQTRHVAAHHRKGQHGKHHNDPVFDIQVFVLPIGIGGHGTGQHIGGQGNAHGHIGVHVQKGDQHGADDCRGAEAGKAGAQTCPHTGKKGDCNGK